MKQCGRSATALGQSWCHDCWAQRDRRGWVLPLLVAAELAWAACLWSGYRSFLPWALRAAIAVGVAAIVVLVMTRLSSRAGSRLATAGLAAGVAAMLAAPRWPEVSHGLARPGILEACRACMRPRAVVRACSAWPRPGTPG
jgi:hypothetical protein